MLTMPADTPIGRYADALLTYTVPGAVCSCTATVCQATGQLADTPTRGLDI